MTSFHLPTKIRGVDYYAFEGCDNLTSMYVNWANLDDLAYYLKQNEDDLKENFDFSRVGVTANHVHYSYRKDLILFGQEKNIFIIGSLVSKTSKNMM